MGRDTSKIPRLIAAKVDVIPRRDPFEVILAASDRVGAQRVLTLKPELEQAASSVEQARRLVDEGRLSYSESQFLSVACRVTVENIFAAENADSDEAFAEGITQISQGQMLAASSRMRLPSD